MRLWNVPKIFRHCSKVMITTWGHDPHFIPIENLLTIINDTLKESPVLIQVNEKKKNYLSKVSTSFMFLGL